MTQIKYDTAQLAREKGFKIKVIFQPINGYYCELNDPQIENVIYPTQSELQKWLREDKCIRVWCEPHQFSSSGGWAYSIIYSKSGTLLAHVTQQSNSVNLQYEQALEAGLFEALKLIQQ